MAIQDVLRRAGPYAWASSGSYPFGFKVFSTTDVVVTVSRDGIESVLTSGYTVTLNSEQDNTPGGTVVLDSSVEEADKVVITSAVPYTQEMVLTNQGGFYPDILNDNSDRIVAQIQQLKEELIRSVKTTVTSEFTAEQILESIYKAKEDSLNSQTAAKSSETNASASEQNAAISENHAEIWAEGSDEQVEPLGGEHSSKGWAELAILNLNEINVSKEAAVSSAAAAAASETAAKSSETAAKSSETAAKSSETAAKSSEMAAEASRASAEASRASAEASEIAAEASEIAAANSAAAAAKSAAQAEGIPVGFVYVQFAGMTVPADLFGGTWSNISSTFAGLFFRAEGGEAASFGSSQTGGLPNLEGTLFSNYFGRGIVTKTGVFANSHTQNNGTKDSVDESVGIVFNAASGNSLYGAASEVRPVNSTIRIWKRTA